MRIFRLVLLFVVAFLIAGVILFPAAPVVDRIRPQLGPVALEGVDGPLYKGTIASVRSTDDLLPLEFQNVGWRLNPMTLLDGGAGADVFFEGYGGGGEGTVMRSFNGDVLVKDFDFTADASTLEPLLPVPIASFAGKLMGDIATVQLADNLLSKVEGTLIWAGATIETSATGIPFTVNLGELQIDIKPEAPETHVVDIAANGGDVVVLGKVTVSLNGDFSADLTLTPSSSASKGVTDNLRRIGRPDASGGFRVQQNGNFNRLM